MGGIHRLPEKVHAEWTTEGLIDARLSYERLSGIFDQLDGELSVGELEAELGISQPSLSREIGRLRNAGVLTPRREAKSVFYSLTNPAMVSLIEALCVACKAMENANDKTGNKIAP
ncbi:MAG: transcriptional regulator [Acidimicrobiales bacterium]|nr:MAG: transcriptional regulator [Acidimicrobiales bacterium]